MLFLSVRPNLFLVQYVQCVTAKLPVLRPGFGTPQSCGRFLLLYCILGGFAASILSLEDAKCEIANLSNSGPIMEFAPRTSETPPVGIQFCSLFLVL